MKMSLRENEPVGSTHEWFHTKTRFDTEEKRQLGNGLFCCHQLSREFEVQYEKKVYIRKPKYKVATMID